MKENKKYKDLEVDYIGGENLTAREEADLDQYFAKKRKLRHSESKENEK